jgi:CMP-N-acetylneuraminic acid synthetase
LIAWTIEAALAAEMTLHGVVVSTDSPEIATIAQDCGGSAPFMRPDELSGDTADMMPVLRHAVDFIESRDQVALDWVLLLQPTAPLRAPEDIDAAVALARRGGCDSVISVEQVFAHHPILMKKIENDRLLPYYLEETEGTRRQDYGPPAYMRNGAIYLTRRDVLMEKKSIWGAAICPYVMPEERSVSIDSERDFLLAELVMREKLGITA